MGFELVELLDAAEKSNGKSFFKSPTLSLRRRGTWTPAIFLFGVRVLEGRDIHIDLFAARQKRRATAIQRADG